MNFIKVTYILNRQAKILVLAVLEHGVNIKKKFGFFLFISVCSSWFRIRWNLGLGGVFGGGFGGGLELGFL